MFEEAERAGSCPKDDACGWVWDFGRHEMTLDVKDPDAAPLFPSNVWVICRTCNTRKQTMRLSQWREFLAYWRWLTSTFPGQLSLPDSRVQIGGGASRGAPVSTTAFPLERPFKPSPSWRGTGRS